ncbi:hypothetical protein N9N16_03375 [Porticoccaceae bacterium]|nr:hypothetical protein [Porticoccaceae bacterium]
MKKITYLLMLLMSIGVHIHAEVNHPSFSSETIFLECDGIKFQGKPRPTIYFYAIDNKKMMAKRLGTDSFEWSKSYPMEKSPAQIKIKQSYGAWIIDRETLTTEHQGFVSSDCKISSLNRVDEIASEIGSKAQI